ncbi:MAG: AMP-binding protein [Nitrospirae bacterium]|nr:AMP-binding protein [Nitrospirota bacterium]MCL5977136.1 AMP-binding protein [Nitrospirota bacterium]
MNTIPSLFRSSVEKNKDRIAFNYFDGSWKIMTYAEFFALSNSIASLLISKGLNRNDRAAIVCENRPEWCAAYMAIVMAGGIAVPIDMQLGSDEIKNLLIDSEAKIIFYSSKTEANVLKAIEGIDIKGINFDVDSFDSAISHQLSAASPEPCDIASIIYTSGTTGKPKGVMLTHENFCSDAAAVIQAQVIIHDDNILSVLPMHHTYPFMCTFLVPLFLGAAVTFSPGLKAAELMPAIKDTGVTIAVTVPRLLEMIRNGIVSKIKEKGLIFLWLMNICGTARRISDINIGKFVFKEVHKNFPKLKFFACGGARLDPSVMEDMEALGFTVLEGYGLTETSPVITFNPAEKRKPGSVGKPLPDVEIKISDDGEITAKGSMVMKGYYKNQAATEDVIRDGWLLTGDTGYMDGEGYVFITGRKKEVIVLSSGKNVYPEDAEKFYASIQLIKEICVTEREGQLHAVIVPDFEYAKKALIGNIFEDLKWRINEVSMKIPEYTRIQGFTLYREPLPRTPLGKLRRFMIKDLIKAAGEEMEVKAEDKCLQEDEVGKRVAGTIKSLIKDEIQIRSSDNLELDLGFDSLKRIELASAIESAFSISLPATFTSEVQTVGDAVSRLKEFLGGRAAKIEKQEVGAYISWKDILQKEPSVDDAKKVGFSFGFVEIAIACILLTAQKILFRFLFGLKVSGRENIPEDGAFVIAPNHASFLDGFAVASSIPLGVFKNLYFLGFQKYFTGKFTAWFARVSHVIPIDMETYLHKALQMSAYVLKNKKALCVFPEGGRSFDGRLMEFKKGIGILAVQLNIPVVPAYIKGTFEAMPRGSKFIRPAKIEVFFGKPISASDIDMSLKPAGTDEYRFFAEELRKRVIALSENR